MKTKIALLFGVILLLSSCGKTSPTPVAQSKPTSTDQTAFNFSPSEKPTLSLIPRADGHLLTMKIDNIPSKLVSLEYELVYTASDNGNDIEKGLGDTVKLNNEPSLTRDLLLGTASCTSGCKYKYDNNVNSGTVTLTFMTADNQVNTFDAPFTLDSGADIKKTGGMFLKDNSMGFKGKPISSADYYVLVKNYLGGFSVFSSGNGKGTVTEYTPSSLTKKDKTTLTGDYLP